MKAPRSGHAVRSRARRGDGERLRETVLEATENLLAETGDEEKVSMRAIAKACGCTPPAIYLHFEDKDALIFEVCARRFNEFGHYIEQAGSTSDDPLESLRRRGVAYVEWGTSNPEPYRVIFMARKQIGPSDYRPEELPGMRAFMQLVDAVDACVRSGAFKPVDVFEAATYIWTATHGLTSALISHPNFPWPASPAEMARGHADFLLKGFLADLG